jgi:hypothetical protein
MYPPALLIWNEAQVEFAVPEDMLWVQEIFPILRNRPKLDTQEVVYQVNFDLVRD